MNRREFMKWSVGAGVVAGTSMVTGYEKLFSSTSKAASLPYHLVAVKGGEPDVMFQKGIEALGGIRAFVKKGQKVVIKPNIGWDVTPERGGNTNPILVAEIVKQCLHAGAKEVYVFDHTCDNWQQCYKHSGMEAAVKNAGGKMAPAHTENYYHDIALPNAKNLKTTKEHELLLESDVFINVPILKNHESTRITISMKNMMGCVWDRRFWHGNDVHQCIADFAGYRKPALNVVDAYYVMKQNGPRGVSTNDVVLMKSQLLSTDIVAIDTAATKLFGENPADVRHIHIAAENKVGRMDIENLNIKRISV